MDLEQLLLAWKLKTNQEVTKSDIEKVFSSLDLSKFKNGETISLTDIFQIMNATREHLTRSPPTTYDEYTEEDVPLDPFYKDVPKVVGTRRKRHSVHKVPVHDNGMFRSHVGRRRGKGSEPMAISIAEIEVITGSVVMREKPKEEVTGRGKVVRRVQKEEEEEPEPEVVTEGRKRGRGRGGVKFKPSPDDTPQEGLGKPIPKTSFSCKDKIPGGFYADTDEDCQLFHICTDGGNGQ